MRTQAPNSYSLCKVCNGTGRYKIFNELDFPPITLYDCDNCKGERFLADSDPRSLVTVPYGLT